ncbi:MAG: low affinity iron permease family protein [Flavobacterium sp.]
MKYNFRLLVEKEFENLTSLATKVLGSTVTFLLALCLVIYWWANNLFSSNNWHQNIGDLIFGITFLSLFIIQKSFNRYSALINLKLNELVSSNQEANNSVLNTQKKTESEITELIKEYIDEEVKEIEDLIIKKK